MAQLFRSVFITLEKAIREAPSMQTCRSVRMLLSGRDETIILPVFHNDFGKHKNTVGESQCS
jgi:hypothetical protein